MKRICVECDGEYDDKDRVGKPGKLTACDGCAEETEIKLSGVMIFSDKTAPEIQINRDPALTEMIRKGLGNPPRHSALKPGALHTPASLSPHRRSHS